MTDVAANVAASAAPDWESLTREILCPMCEYNLRGLGEPRCPECGYRFEWREVLDPALRLHPYLFEIHPERNFWSFFQTIVGGFQPVKFWSQLNPAQPSNPRRLGIYLMLNLIPAVVCFAMVFWEYYLAASAMWTGMPRLWPLTATWSSYTVMISNTRMTFLFVVTLAMLSWPIITALGLLVFHASMKRAKVRSIHTLRCVAYSADALGPFGLMFIIILFIRWNLPPWYAWYAIDFWIFALALLLIYRLFTAYRLYMRFDHALATVLVSQIFFALLLFKLMFMLDGY